MPVFDFIYCQNVWPAKSFDGVSAQGLVSRFPAPGFPDLQMQHLIPLKTAENH
jgi:hypothetical protein